MSGASSPAVDVRVLRVGGVTMPHGYVFRPQLPTAPARFAAAFRPGAESLTSPLLAYVLRHPQAGPVLVDTGLHPDAQRDLHGDYGPVLGRVFSSLRFPAESYVEQLEGCGVRAGDFELVAMTHLHVDHTGGMRLLPHAEFVCCEQEWAAANARRAVMKGYAGHHLPPAERMRLVRIDRDGDPHGPFARTLDLLGDGSIRLLATPGHSAGHLSVLVRTGADEHALLAGDAVYTLRNLREERLPLITLDDALSLRSMRELAAFAREHPAAPLVPTHDPDAWRQLEG